MHRSVRLVVKQVIHPVVNLVRLLFIALCLATPTVLLGWVVWGKKGAALGICVTVVWMFIIGIWSERGVARAHCSDFQTPQGLKRSLEYVIEGQKGRIPNLYVFADPSPNGLTVRSLGGRGTILLSQGLIALLNEEELRTILKLCVTRIRAPGIVFQSFCSMLAVWTLGFAPKGWVNLVYVGRSLTQSEEQELSPISAIVFLLIYPVVQFFLRFGKSTIPLEQPSHLGEAYAAAMQKVLHTVHILGPTKTHGAFSLYFIDPRSGKLLFPYR